jgi:hypothetical protein
MHVVIQPSPSVTHKLRVTLPNMRAIDFGDRSVQHYPDHGNPRLMRAHLIRVLSFLRSCEWRGIRMRFIER